MAEYIYCKNCNNMVEFKPERKYEGGTSYITFICPKCGHIKEYNVNHRHYGQDGIN